jgi:Rps23 Pro-64 3,4-dihydroxylase Tpa1-like proline 4-hydroxylase
MTLSIVASAAPLDLDLLSLLPSPEFRSTIIKDKQSYRDASPFPHICIDGFLPHAVAEAVHDAFPGPGEKFWARTSLRYERKLSTNLESDIPATIRNVLYALNTRTFLEFLEELTGIESLIPDPHFTGGGMHQIVRGGKLDIHVDYNKHFCYGLDRRLNLLLFLNKDWHEGFGGDLELWDERKRRCARRIAPLFNRCVIFSTSDRSYHGHPHPLECPESRSRKSLALYYFSNGRPAGEVDFDHGTQWLETVSPGYRLMKTLRHVSGVMLRETAPPLLYRLMRSAKHLLQSRRVHRT